MRPKRTISGHIKFLALKNLGWDEYDIRYIETDNERIALIEYRNV